MADGRIKIELTPICMDIVAKEIKNMVVLARSEIVEVDLSLWLCFYIGLSYSHSERIAKQVLNDACGME